MINNDRVLNYISIEIFPLVRAQMERREVGRKIERSSEIIFTLQSVLRYELSWYFYVRGGVRLSLARTGIRAFRVKHISYCARMYVRTNRVSCLDRGWPNVKRNFTVRLRAIALSLTDTLTCMAKLLLYYLQSMLYYPRAKLYYSRSAQLRDVRT